MTANIDTERVKARVNDIDERVRKIRRYAAVDDASFWADERNIIAIKLASIGIHLTAKVLKAAPVGYVDCFAKLCESEVVSRSLGERLKAVGQFLDKYAA